MVAAHRNFAAGARILLEAIGSPKKLSRKRLQQLKQGVYRALSQAVSEGKWDVARVLHRSYYHELGGAAQIIIDGTSARSTRSTGMMWTSWMRTLCVRSRRDDMIQNTSFLLVFVLPYNFIFTHSFISQPALYARHLHLSRGAGSSNMRIEKWHSNLVLYFLSDEQ